jgi:hypothetical protein
MKGDDRDHGYAVSELLYHPYWTRMWILQEIVLAQSILVLCCIDLRTLMSLREWNITLLSRFLSMALLF